METVSQKSRRKEKKQVIMKTEKKKVNKEGHH